jgi:multiple antibiotic resistance protein
MSLVEYTLLALSSLFVIVDPIAVIPAFLAMTPHDAPGMRLRMARLACIVAAGVLLSFALFGPYIFRLLGLTLPAFQIAGSIILMGIALDMLHGRRSAVQSTREETLAGTEKEDVAITPLAVPMLAGPGAISTSLILLNQADTWDKRIALYLVIPAIFIVSYFILKVSVHGAQRLSPIALKIITRLMGLLLAALAVQFGIDALTQLRIIEPMR